MHRVKRALHHIHHESGQMLVLMVAGLAAFVAIVGLSVDVGQIVFTRTDLQKVADAAAFAGAQDLPSSSAATVSANTYVGLNAANTTADVAISQTYNANDTIRVTARRKVNYTFMRVLGLTGTDVSASATVRVGTYNGGSGLVPWGLVASDNSDFLGNECFAGFDGEMPLFNQNTVCTLKYGAGENSGGDFGIVALDGTGSDIYEYGIINGSTTVYEVDDQVNPQTGNNVGKTRSGIDGRLARPLPEDCQTHDRNEILHTDQATGLTTQQANPALQGKANLYVGTTVVPYYQKKPANVNDASILTSFWVSATPPPAAFFPNATAPYFITRFNPIPVAQGGNTTIPLLVTVPNASANAANGGCTKPAAGWPVAIVQHGLGGNRTQALAMADGFADACFVVAAIDLPLHGITDTANPFYQAPNERTFNVDFVNNTTGATGPDGRIDASGTHALPTILSSPPTARDSLRQGQADIGVLTKSLANLDLTGDNVSDIDPARIHYVGLSLGGIVGAAQARYNPGVQTVTVSVPGGVISKLVLDSATFGATIRAGLLSSFSKNPASASFPDNGASFQQFFREVQTIIDPADPFNQVCACAGTKPLFLQKVRGDTVVPNNSTDRLITAANMTKLRSGVNAVTAGQPAYLTMTAGSHGSLFDPTTSLPATVEMQSQVIRFAASANQPGGPFVVITNPAIVEQ